MSYLTPNEIIVKRKEFLFPGVHHFYQNPPHIVRGSMQYLYDHTGKEYVDLFAGVSVMNCGHCNPEIAKATIAQLTTLQHTTTIYLTEPIIRLAKRLAEILPGNLKHTFFCNSGSEANEGALLLARLYTGKKKFIYFSGGLHGRTQLTAAVTGIDMWRGAPYLEEFYRAPGFQEADSLTTVTHLLKSHDDIAGIITEPIQGNGGIMVPPAGFMDKLHALAESHGVLLIMDEVQTGYGRTGKWFGSSHHAKAPHILTSAKALGNGYPIATFSTTPKIAEAMNIPSASTLGGHPTAAATALAVINYIETHNLAERAKTLGDFFLQELQRLAEKTPLIQQVRGQGLMVGAELANAELTDQVIEAMKDKGFLVGKNGLKRNVLAFQPPLVITHNDISRTVATLGAVLQGL